LVLQQFSLMSALSVLENLLVAGAGTVVADAPYDVTVTQSRLETRARFLATRAAGSIASRRSMRSRVWWTSSPAHLSARIWPSDPRGWRRSGHARLKMARLKTKGWP
jgi:hypothetical protein